jgi:hypothetical protein
MLGDNGGQVFWGPQVVQQESLAVASLISYQFMDVCFFALYIMHRRFSPYTS